MYHPGEDPWGRYLDVPMQLQKNITPTVGEREVLEYYLKRAGSNNPNLTTLSDYQAGTVVLSFNVTKEDAAKFSHLKGVEVIDIVLRT